MKIRRRDAARDWLKEYLSDEPKMARLVLEAGRAAGFSEQLLQRTKTEFGVRSKVVRGKKGKIWYHEQWTSIF